eukprot:SAG22_NODE_10127_length_551_cov_1.221239_2_plen_40_part_01
MATAAAGRAGAAGADNPWPWNTVIFFGCLGAIDIIAAGAA